MFISSTSDLSTEREAVAEFLASIEFEADWFEVWPASPDEPIAQCLEHVAESDALAAARRVWVDALKRFPSHEAADQARNFFRPT